MKSSTVKFNIFAFFSVIIALGLVCIDKLTVNSFAWVVVIVIIALASQGITFFSPSGEFVGTGQDWTVGKWVTRIGAALIAALFAINGYGIAAGLTAAVQPFIEVIMRVYGTDTAAQRVAAKATA